MGLQKVVEKGVERIFTVLKDAVKSGIYTLTDDKGWGTTSSQTVTVRVILDQFSQKDVESVAFAELLQPTDTKGLVPGKDLTLGISTAGNLTIAGRTYSIVAFETDPFGACYTLLLRDAGIKSENVAG